MNDARYRPDIDGLRAIAVLMVVAYHAAPTVLPGGFVGVDVFFVVSGYLITGNIIRDLDRGAFTFLDFYARRFRRIVPALVVVLAAVWAASSYALLPTEVYAVARHIVAGATFTTNLVLWREAGYFDVAAESKPLLHLWSLAIEEQFYLVWPPLLLLASRMRVRRDAVILVLLVASFTLNVALVSNHAIATFYLLPTRLWELMLGGALAQYQNGTNRLNVVRKPVAEATGAAALTVLVATAFMVNGRSTFPGWWALGPTLTATLLIMTGERAWVGRSVMSWKPAVLIGLVSYPLYLWHYPLLALGRIVNEANPPIRVRVTLVTIAMLLAWLTWRVIEQPIQKRFFVFHGSRRLMTKCVVGSLVCLTAIATAGWTTRESRGYAARARAQAFDDLTRLQRFGDTFPACSGDFARGRSLSWCYTSTPGDPDLAIFGDSHAYYLFPGFAEQYRLRGVNLLVIGQTACAPLFNVRSFQKGTTDQCLAANALALKLLSASRTVRTVVLASLGPFYFSGSSFAADHSGINDAANWMLESADSIPGESKPQMFARGLAATVSLLEQAGKRVILFIDVPELDFRPEACVDRPLRLLGSHARTPCGVAKSRVTERQAAYRHLIAQVVSDHPGVRVFDPLDSLCGAELCNAKDGTRLLYRDSHHVSVYGSEYLAARFEPWLDGFHARSQ